MNRGALPTLAMALLLAACPSASSAPDRPEFPLDEPTAISPGNEYHLEGTKLYVRNTELVAGPSVEFLVANAGSTSALRLRSVGDSAIGGGYLFALKAIDPARGRAVIVVSARVH
jgi:hypothetical protein